MDLDSIYDTLCLLVSCYLFVDWFGEFLENGDGSEQLSWPENGAVIESTLCTILNYRIFCGIIYALVFDSVFSTKK